MQGCIVLAAAALGAVVGPHAGELGIGFGHECLHHILKLLILGLGCGRGNGSGSPNGSGTLLGSVVLPAEIAPVGTLGTALAALTAEIGAT